MMKSSIIISVNDVQLRFMNMDEYYFFGKWRNCGRKQSSGSVF